MDGFHRQLILIPPDPIWEDEVHSYKQEHLQQGETELHGGVLLDRLPYPDWLALAARSAVFEAVSPDWVVSSTFFVVRSSDHRLVGMVNIRHTLNEYQRCYSGHIGYGVRPSERGKGYAGQILRLSLEFARSIGLKQVMLVCDKSNRASRRTILANGGVLERECVHPDGEPIEIYWITLA